MPRKGKALLLGSGFVIVAALAAMGSSKKSTSVTHGSDSFGKHYTFEDLTTTSTGIDNSPDTDTEYSNIAYTSRMLDLVVNAIGYAPTVNSAYRSDAVNDAVDGVKTSEHLTGLGVDLHIGKSSNEDSKEKLRILEVLYNSGIALNQVIAYGIDSNGNNDSSGKSHIHISFPTTGNGKQQYLTTVKGNSGTFNTWNPSTFA